MSRQLNGKYWPHQCILINGEIHDVCNWCRETIGVQGKDWVWFTHGYKTTFALNNEENMLLFKLKWGQYEISKKDNS